MAAGLLTAEEAALALSASEGLTDNRARLTAPPAGIVPVDAAEPVGAVPDEVEITAADIDAALEAWDEIMPEYVGLLDAEADHAA